MALAAEPLGVVRLLADAVPATGPARARPRPLPARLPAEALRARADEPCRREAALAAVLARPRVARRLQAVPPREGAHAGASAAAAFDAAAAVEAEAVVARRGRCRRLGLRRPAVVTVESHLRSCAVQRPLDLHHFKGHVLIPHTLQAQLEEQAIIPSLAGDLPQLQNVEVGLDESEGFRVAVGGGSC